MIDNARIRAQAMQALRGHWQNTLLVMFIAMLPSLIATVVRQLLLMPSLTELLNALTGDRAEELMANPAAMLELVPASAILISIGAAALALLVAAPFKLGAWHYDAELLRGRPGTVRDVLCRMQHWGKAVALELWMDLWSVIWCLPGIALVYAMIPLLMIENLTLNAMYAIVEICTYGGMLLIVILLILARLRYAVAPYIMAERPEETGVRQAVRESKAMMKRRKGQYLLLTLSYLMPLMIATLLSNMLAALFGNVIGTTVSLMLELVINVMLAVTRVCFFLTYDEASEKPAPLPPMPTPLN